MLLAALAALLGAAVQSATGFGFALVLSPALFAVMEPTEAVTALLLLGAVLNVLVLLEGHDVRWPLLPRLIAPGACRASRSAPRCWPPSRASRSRSAWAWP